MAKLMRVPEIAANATNAVLVEWVVKEGDVVNAGDGIATIETDKAAVELTADHDGTIGRLLVQAGAKVVVGEPVCMLLGENETAADIAVLLEQVQPGRESALPSVPVDRIFASPLARRLAKEKELDLAALDGSGPNGRIIKLDVERAAIGGKSITRPGAGEAYDVVGHTNMRKTIARRLTESKATIPHFYLKAVCRMDALLALREQINQAAPRRISINDFLIKAAACALRDVPDMNVIWTDEAMHRYRSADIAVAVATETGLITPVVRSAEEKTLSAIATAMAELAERARASQLAPNEYQGGTLAISNLGMHGAADFTAIINPPQSAILAVGAVQKTPVVVDDAIRIATMMRCTLSVDHRAIDGATAAQWLAVFTRHVENPASMLI